MNKVKKGNTPEDCWIWKGTYIRNLKYASQVPRPVFSVKNSEGKIRIILAHRYMYALTHGVDLPKSRYMSRTCNNPKCVNPAHFKYTDPPDRKREKKTVEQLFDEIPDELIEAVNTFMNKLKDIQTRHRIGVHVLKRIWSTISHDTKIKLFNCPEVCGCYNNGRISFLTYCAMMKDFAGGMNQREVAVKYKVSESTVSRMLIGER